jgi:DNA polymerase kappa
MLWPLIGLSCLQFFEPLQGELPHKRPKLSDDEIETGAELDAPGDFELHDTAEEAMPGFYEHEDEAINLGKHADDLDLVDPRPPDLPRRQSSTSKPVSESRLSDILRPSTSFACNSRFGAKPYSASATIRPKSSASNSGTRPSISESLMCPVCGKLFQIDNEGLNAHIDLCLSRGAIRQAHAEASNPVKKNIKGIGGRTSLEAYSQARGG